MSRTLSAEALPCCECSVVPPSVALVPAAVAMTLQDPPIKVDVSTSEGSTTWYTSPQWLAIIGLALVLIVVIAVMAGRRKRTTTTARRLRVVEEPSRKRRPKLIYGVVALAGALTIGAAQMAPPAGPYICTPAEFFLNGFGSCSME
mgnify:CR=1 FL=1